MDRTEYIQKLYEVKRIIKRLSDIDSELKALDKVNLSKREIRHQTRTSSYKKSVETVFLLALIPVVILALLNAISIYRSRYISVEALQQADAWHRFLTFALYFIGRIIIHIPIAIGASAIAALYYSNRMRKEGKTDEEIRRQNAENGSFNMRLKYLSPIVSEKREKHKTSQQVLIKRYKLHCETWFPRDYGYYEAIDFFIKEFQNHTSGMEQAILNYKQWKRDQKTDEFRKKFLQNQERQIAYQEIMIDQENMLLSELDFMQHLMMIDLIRR